MAWRQQFFFCIISHDPLGGAGQRQTDTFGVGSRQTNLFPRHSCMVVALRRAFRAEEEEGGHVPYH